MQADNRPCPAGRTFGLAIAVDGAAPAVAERTPTLPAAPHRSLLFAGASNLGGRDAFTAVTAGRLRKTLGDSPERFVTTHETWWRVFWARAYFKPDDKDGTLRALATDLVEFMRLRYPRREPGRMVIAPCNAGETWQRVRDPAEVVCALRLALPRLISVGKNQGWDRSLIAGWEELLAATPDIPRGRLQYGGPEALPVILPGDQLVPAADMSGCETYVLPWSQGKSFYQLDAQPTERDALWPAKLVLRGETDRDRARRSYRNRLFQHHWDAWNFDVVFAACRGVREEVAQWHDRHFARTFVFPYGLARETAQNHPAAPSLPESPSLQGMGTGVVPVLEMLLQDYPDELIALPCWPEAIAVDFKLCS